MGCLDWLFGRKARIIAALLTGMAKHEIEPRDTGMIDMVSGRISRAFEGSWAPSLIGTLSRAK